VAALPRDRLLGALERLIQSRAPEARLVAQAGPVYLIWISTPEGAELVQECVSSTALPPAFKLSSERGKILRDLGFAKRSGRRNWKRHHGREASARERVVDETLDIFERVYGVTEPLVLTLSEDEDEHPQNPDLVAAMRKVAKGWDEAVRRAMYTEMLNATFLMPLDPNLGEDAEGSEAFLDFETHESGRPTLGVFTDWASLRLWEPRGHGYWAIHGSQLFEMVLERNPVTLRINPNGDVGGELYAHEVEMLVRAVRTFRRRQN
jgi:hypothetical protein